MTKELVLLYFRNKCTLQEDLIVEEWLKSSPENTQLALKWMDELSDEEEKLFLNVVLEGNDVWKETISKIDPDLNEEPRTSNFGLSFRHLYLQTNRYAAAVASILMIAFAFYLYKIHATVDIKTGFGKVKEIRLPDGSNVILNGNSQLKYQSSWKQGPREVWLDGEAFFSVRHKSDNSSFTVHLSGKKAIEVLGTEFNVSDRAHKSSIFLKSGKIALHLADKHGEGDIVLLPGESLELEKKSYKKISPVKVSNPETYYSWTQQKWVFDKTSLKEILEKLEENYGVHVIAESEELLTKQVSGSIPLSSSENADVLIADVASIFQVEVIRKGNEIILSKKL